MSSVLKEILMLIEDCDLIIKTNGMRGYSMGYTIEPMSLVNFLDGNQLKLPRFQRKATWDKKQNFELAVSVFQDYPVGVVIVNQERDAGWLLDGRQRRNALQTMRENPVELYEWARTYLAFKNTADDSEVRNAYWNKVEKYLVTEEQRESDTDQQPYEGEEDNIPDSFDSEKQRKGLNILLDLILMVHQNKKDGSKWEKNFDFTKYTKKLKYAPERNNYKIEPRLLRKFILDIYDATEKRSAELLTETNVYEYFNDNTYITDEDNFKKELSKRWSDIKKSIQTIGESEKIFNDGRIGIIRLTNASPLDAQNIFSRINRGGTQLKAEELLSAKPYWNKKVNVLDQNVISMVKDMYRRLEIDAPDTVVRWDMAAIMLSRIDKNHLIFDNYDDKNSSLSMDKLSMGFKLISSIYDKGMSAKSVIELENNENINWDLDIDKIVNELNTVINILETDSFFNYLLSWKQPMSKLLGNAIALEFITVMHKDWKDRGKPVVSSGELKALIKDGRALFDRLVFEYSTKVWRGSGDSKMHNDIKDWKTRIKSRVSKDEWKDFISKACHGMYNGQQTTKKLLTPVLYYSYVLNLQSPIHTGNTQFEVDHIIPQESFVGSAITNQQIKDSLANFALLPKKDNIKKGSKTLNSITDNWLKTEVAAYTGIKLDDFDKYSDYTHLDEFVSERESIMVEIFSTKRESMLIN